MEGYDEYLNLHCSRRTAPKHRSRPFPSNPIDGESVSRNRLQEVARVHGARIGEALSSIIDNFTRFSSNLVLNVPSGNYQPDYDFGVSS